MTRVFIFMLGVIFINACSDSEKRPAGILKAKKMQAVLWDVIKAEAFTAEFIKKDSTKDAALENEKLLQQVFAIHKTTRAEFYKSYNYYKTNTAEFTVILDSMISKAQTENTKKTFSKPFQVE